MRFRLRTTRPDWFRSALATRLLTLLVLALVSMGGPSAAKKETSEPASDGGWPELTPEERSLTSAPMDPEADAVLLRNDREGKIVKLADDTVNQLQYHWRLKVLKASGKAHGEVRIPASRFSRISNLEARTVKADGTVVPVPKDQIFAKVVFQIGDYKVTEQVFNFPAVEPGAILEYRFQRTEGSFFALLALRSWYFEGEVPTLASRVRQTVPAGMGYAIACDVCGGAKPQVTEYREGKEKGQTYSMELKNLPGYHSGLFMPPAREVSPHLEMALQIWKDHYLEQLGRQDNFFTDWPSVVKFIRANYQDAFSKGRDQLKTSVDGWTQGIADPQDRMKAIYRHVQRDFRYVPFDEEVYGYIRPLPDVLKSGWADNEEKAVLLQGALKAAGVESELALVSGKDTGPVNPKFFGPRQFTHGVVIIPDASGSLRVLDPTDSFAPFGFMPWRDSGAAMLRLKEGQGEIQSLPERGEVSTTRYRIQLKPLPDGRADMEIEAKFTGEDAVAMREELAPVSESARVDAIKNWLGEAHAGASLVAQSIENLENTDEPLVLKVTAQAPGLVTLAENAAIVRGCVLFCFDGNPISRAARRYPLYVDKGFNVEQVVVITAPAGMTAPDMPSPVVAKTAVASLMIRCDSGEGGSVSCTRTFLARRNRWDASEMDGVRSMFDKVVEADRTGVTFQAGAASGS